MPRTGGAVERSETFNRAKLRSSGNGSEFVGAVCFARFGLFEGDDASAVNAPFAHGAVRVYGDAAAHAFNGGCHRFCSTNLLFKSFYHVVITEAVLTPMCKLRPIIIKYYFMYSLSMEDHLERPKRISHRFRRSRNYIEPQGKEYGLFIYTRIIPLMRSLGAIPLGLQQRCSDKTPPSLEQSCVYWTPSATLIVAQYVAATEPSGIHGVVDVDIHSARRQGLRTLEAELVEQGKLQSFKSYTRRVEDGSSAGLLDDLCEITRLNERT